MLLMFAALAVPLVQLTSAKPVMPVSAPTEDVTLKSDLSKPVPTLIRARFAHQPKLLTVKLGERLLLNLGIGPSPVEASTSLVIPVDGIELQVDAEWPSGTPDTALTLEVEPDGLDTKTETRWSNGPALSDFVPFVWKR